MRRAKNAGEVSVTAMQISFDVDKVNYFTTDDIPEILRNTIVAKIEEGDEGVNESVFRSTLDRAISPE